MTWSHAICPKSGRDGRDFYIEGDYSDCHSSGQIETDATAWGGDSATGGDDEGATCSICSDSRVDRVVTGSRDGRVTVGLL